MSGIAGFIRFDGGPVEPGAIEKMTSAMASRGPDGINHWHKGSVAMGQCMLRTTPESLEESQPHTNQDESLVLVMDGRVDNWVELRHQLLSRGAILRDRSDTELVLRAYEVWGDQCLDFIIGEFAFFIWDARQRRLFGARDAAGTRFFNYYADSDWFAFASEIKGLLSLDQIEPRLNESRLLDYLVVEYDRDDEIGTFYKNVFRLPVGHAIEVTDRGVKTWRYWNPGNLPELKFASHQECLEAFTDQLRVATKCRLRSIGPVGAMLSGGLDSSAIVGLIRKEFRSEVSQPLQTFSLIQKDRENCKDWEFIQHMLKDGWINPTIISSDLPESVSRSYIDGIQDMNEPFELSHGLTYSLVYRKALETGCRVVLDGMAGDLLFYSPQRSLNCVVNKMMVSEVLPILAAFRRHDMDDGTRTLVRRIMAELSPQWVHALYQNHKERRGIRASEFDEYPGNLLNFLHSETAEHFLVSKSQYRKQREKNIKKGNDQAAHSRNFTSGLLSFAHEVYGQIALSSGVEPRSPLSDRRMLEFAIQMPLEAKLSTSWYKNFLRQSMSGILPEAVRWRSDIGSHPGWTFDEKIISDMAKFTPKTWDSALNIDTLRSWIDFSKLDQAKKRFVVEGNYSTGYNLFIVAILSNWMSSRPQSFRNGSN